MRYTVIGNHVVDTYYGNYVVDGEIYKSLEEAASACEVTVDYFQCEMYKQNH